VKSAAEEEEEEGRTEVAPLKIESKVKVYECQKKSMICKNIISKEK
jgi:hypothetical protein